MENGATSAGVDPSGTYAFLGTPWQLLAFDVRHPTNPTLIASHPSPGTLRDILWLNDRLYTAASTMGMLVFRLE